MWLKKFLVSRGADRQVLDKLNGSQVEAPSNQPVTAHNTCATQALRRYGLQHGYLRTGDEPDAPEGAR